MVPYAFRREVGPAQPAGAVTKWSLNRGLIAPFSSSPPDYRMKFPRMLHAKWQSSRPPLAPIIPLLTAEGRAIFYTSPQSISASFREIRPFFLFPLSGVRTAFLLCRACTPAAGGGPGWCFSPNAAVLRVSRHFVRSLDWHINLHLHLVMRCHRPGAGG